MLDAIRAQRMILNIYHHFHYLGFIVKHHHHLGPLERGSCSELTREYMVCKHFKGRTAFINLRFEKFNNDKPEDLLVGDTRRSAAI